LIKGKIITKQKMVEKKVVIIGGGAAGAVLAKTIQHHATVTLIDP
jgi:NADH dehydrogenase FAD-containing subunit